MRIITLLSIPALVGLIGCSKPNVAGATSETTNGYFNTVVVGTAGYPLKNAEIYLRESDKITGEDTISAITDENGSFELEKVPHGEYWIEVVGENGHRAKVEWSVDSINNVQDEVPHSITIREPGSVVGKVSSMDTSLLIEIPGLNRKVKSLNNGEFIVDSLPVGDYDLILSTKKEGIVDSRIAHVQSGKGYNIGTVQVSTKYSADSAVVAQILRDNNIDIHVDSVTRRNKMEIIELNIVDYGEQFTYLSPDVKKLSLIKLNIPGNRLDTIPEEVTEIETLEYIDLTGNGLLELPENMGNLKNCSNLDLEGNNLRELPESMLEMESIKYYGIYVNDNMLKDIPYKLRHWLDKYSLDKNWEQKQRDYSY